MKKTVKQPHSWKENYPSAKWQAVSPVNFNEFLLD